MAPNSLRFTTQFVKGITCGRFLHAHGSEAAAASLASYAIGFTLSTATLHAIGIGLGMFAVGSIRQVALRAMGGLTALIGIALMVI